VGVIHIADDASAEIAMTLPWRTAWVTGASSGIGRALALRLAAQGVTVAASARRVEALHELTKLNPKIHAFPLDVTDTRATKAVVTSIQDTRGPIELAVLNAGIGQRMGVDNFDAEVAAQTMAVNYQGLVNGVAALLPGMRERRSGRIALMSSVAGYRGLPRAAAYAPSKAAAISLAESLRPELQDRGISISIINPGYVETPLTENARYPLPFVISAEDAASRIISGLARGKFEIAFPWQMVWMLKLGRLMPYPLFFWMMKRGGKRQGQK
jgi:short-subunit dehydrogenase